MTLKRHVITWYSLLGKWGEYRVTQVRQYPKDNSFLKLGSTPILPFFCAYIYYTTIPNLRQAKNILFKQSKHTYDNITFDNMF